MTQERQGDGESSTNGQGAFIGGLLIVAGIAAGIYLLAKAVDPIDVTASQDAGFLEIIVGNRTTLTAVRLGLVAFMAYGVFSCALLMSQGRPLAKIGLAEADAGKLAQETGDSATQRAETLKQELDEANDQIQFLVEYVQELQDALQARDDDADH